MTDDVRRYTLHPSVIALWGLPHHPYYLYAIEVLLDLENGLLATMVTDDFRDRVREIISEPASQLYRPAGQPLSETLFRVERLISGIDQLYMHEAATRTLDAPARRLIESLDWEQQQLYEAQLVILAGLSEAPLLYADERLRPLFAQVGQGWPTFRALWIQEY